MGIYNVLWNKGVYELTRNRISALLGSCNNRGCFADDGE